MTADPSCRPLPPRRLAGITAPGLLALAAALHCDGFATFSVSAPSGERSAQSHCISVGKHLHAWQLEVEGAEEAFAVDGTPGQPTRWSPFSPAPEHVCAGPLILSMLAAMRRPG